MDRRGNDFVESESIKTEKEIEKEKQTVGRIKEEQSQLKKDIDSIKEYQIRFVFCISIIQIISSSVSKRSLIL